METTDIQLYRKISEANDPISQIEKMGNFLAKSGAFGCGRLEQGQLLALICVSENKPPTQIMREWHVMEDGKLMPKTRHVHAQFLKAGGKIEWILTGHEETDPQKIVAKAKFSFGDGKPLEFSYSIQDAKKQGLYSVKPGSSWQKNPAAMCKARLITLGVDFFCPWLVQGDVAEEDSAAPTSQTIDLGKPAATVTAEPAKPEPTPAKAEPQVIDAQVVPEPPKAAAPQPAAQPTPPPASGLPHDLLNQLENAITPVHAMAALTWLRKEGRLKPDQSLANLSEPYARNIIKNTAKFIETINKVKTP